MISIILCRPSYKIPFKLERLFYDSRTKYDTIFAPATTTLPNKGSPLAVIRVSGIKAGDVLSKLTEYVTLPTDSKKIIKPRLATLAKLQKPITRELIDEGLIIWFPKPNSYTGDDVCELHVHGSNAIVKTMLGILAKMPGLRPAEPGEFTRRAVLNNKMSLMQAEGLSDLISSQTENQRRLALEGLLGSTNEKYNSWIEVLVNILAHLEASIDFGEDELIGEQELVKKCIVRLKKVHEEIVLFTRVNEYRKNIIQDGIKVAILGKPNAGKSTFMNLLCGSERSIVSSLEGTTRDVVEHTIELSGHSLILCDTAGLRDLTGMINSPHKEGETELVKLHESIECEGIRRAIEKAKHANLIIYLIDGSKLSAHQECLAKIFKELQVFLSPIGSKIPIFLVINKMDLNHSLPQDDILKKLTRVLKDVQIIGKCLISCKTGKNLDKFLAQLCTNVIDLIGQSERQLVENLSKSSIFDEVELSYINERHTSLLISAQKHLERASALDLKTIDKMAQHVRESVDYLSRIVGTVSNEQVFDIIFRDFCIGK